jgi:carboxymethylenebutenolidase
MQISNVKIPVNGGTMGGYLVIPEGPPKGAIIAIQEIWGVNSVMRHHADEFARAGFICIVPDLFWRQEPGVELTPRNPEDVTKAFDLYYDFDYDLAVADMKMTMAYLKNMPECNGKVGAVGYCLGGKLCYLMCCRSDIDCAVAYYGTYIEHHIKEAPKLHHPFLLHVAMKDRWVQTEVAALIERRLSPNPLVKIEKYPEAEHGFARTGEKAYSKPDAERALGITLSFFQQHL